MSKHDQALFQIGEVTKIMGITRKTLLPRQSCYCRRYQCEDILEAAMRLRDTYIAAARTGKMSMSSHMFTMRMSQASDKLDLMCCIPVDESYIGPEHTEFTETPALCIYYRGPYEGTSPPVQLSGGKYKKYLLQFLAEGIIFMGYEAEPNCPWEDKMVCSLTIPLIPTR